ncbi:unnamed protein product [Ilex paraguariensis]|uniref:Uncharacterized protein n=1 Tax=Ilex paraguariensis TaxID=185542 RepID=A0ABC8TNJ4_9AQUA
MPMNKESTPPPKIGKIGPYTVFVTPPATPKPTQLVSESLEKTIPPPLVQLPKTTVSPLRPPTQSPVKTVSQPPPPVQAPPQQFNKSADVRSPSTFGFFWNAVSKVQNAHSSLDEYVAHWFGLNQSKYQWALDDYYQSNGSTQVDAIGKDVSSKMQRDLCEARTPAKSASEYAISTCNILNNTIAYRCTKMSIFTDWDLAVSIFMLFCCGG